MKFADVEIGPAVVVEIAPARRHAVAIEIDAALARDLGELHTVVVAIQRAVAVVGDEQIEVAVEIEIGDARPDTAICRRPRHAADAQRGRDVLEMSVRPGDTGRSPRLPGSR